MSSMSFVGWGKSILLTSLSVKHRPVNHIKVTIKTAIMIITREILTVKKE